MTSDPVVVALLASLLDEVEDLRAAVDNIAGRQRAPDTDALANAVTARLVPQLDASRRNARLSRRSK